MSALLDERAAAKLLGVDVVVLRRYAVEGRLTVRNGWYDAAELAALVRSAPAPEYTT